MGCQLCLLPPPLCHRHPRRCHLPKVTSARIIFDKAFRQMKFKWLHICWGIPPPLLSPLPVFPHFRLVIFLAPLTSPLLATGHFSMSAPRCSFSFPHYAASHYLCLFACLALCCCSCYCSLCCCCCLLASLFVSDNRRR